MATDDYLYEYAVVRYVPIVEREEFLNIGLIMLCKRKKWLNGRIELDEERLRAFDPKVNLLQLKNQTGVFCRQDVPEADIPVEEKYRWLAAVKSATIQVSQSHPGIAQESNSETISDSVSLLNNEFNRLFNRLVTKSEEG